jgi:hypothetical protein
VRSRAHPRRSIDRARADGIVVLRFREERDMRSKDRALRAPARLHSNGPIWCHRFAASVFPEICDAGVTFLSAHGRPRGPITTLIGPGSTDAAGTSHEP